jgi:hypothetical protein
MREQNGNPFPFLLSVPLLISYFSHQVVPQTYSCKSDSTYYGKKRANKVVVKRLLYLDGKEVDAKHFGRSDHSWLFVYRAGGAAEMAATEGDMEFSDATKACVPGIHYFDTEEHARKLAQHWTAINGVGK